MTDHIGDGNQMVPDLDALKKLADAFDSGAYSTSGAMARTYGAGGKIRAAQDIKALIAELKEAKYLLGHVSASTGPAHDLGVIAAGYKYQTHPLSNATYDRISAFLARNRKGEG